MSLKFTCPDCGKHVIECCLDGPHTCPITEINDKGDHEYGDYESSADVDRFQCENCGFIIPGNVMDDWELQKWVKENCKQS